MPYYPKTKIKTDLFSNGELVRVSDLSSYTGPYYELSTGQKYVGKNAQSLKYPEELINPLELAQTPPTTLTTEIATSISSVSSISKYVQNLKKIPVGRKVPIPFYPTPTTQDYQVGYFSRYFAKQVNDFIFIEINQSTFESLSSHDTSYIWELYNTTYIPWQISGDIEKVYKTNRNLVKIEEQKGFKGLSKFLKEDYIKFYQK